jgi:hypothetical protein
LRRNTQNAYRLISANLPLGEYKEEILVGVRGFEPPASTSRTWRSTRLSYTPNCVSYRKFAMFLLCQRKLDDQNSRVTAKADNCSKASLNLLPGIEESAA